MTVANDPEAPTTLAKIDPTAGFGSVDSFALLQRGGTLLAASSLVPKEYQGNVPNCVIALNMAQRIGADPLMVMQNLHIVHGRPGWSAQFLIATFNQCGRFTALRYEWFGEAGTDAWGCRAWAIEKSTGEKLTGSAITIALAKSEQWLDRAGSKWKTMPEQMLMYRSAAWFVRAYAPEIAMGLQTTDEIHDTVIDVTPGANGGYRVPVTATPETLLAGTATGQDMQQPGDPRGELLTAIAAARGSLEKPIPDAPWAVLCKAECGTTVLETADAAVLGDFLGFVKALVAKDPQAIKKAAKVLEAK